MSVEELKEKREQLLSVIDIRDVLETVGLDIERELNNDYFIECPFKEHHTDSTPSCSVNKDRGYFYCHGCGENGTFFDLIARRVNKHWQVVFDDLYDAYTKMGKISGSSVTPTPVADDDEEEEDTRPPIDIDLILGWHDNLMNSSPVELFRLENDWGISKTTLKKYSIGFDGDRYTIPIFDEDGYTRNVRKYDPDDKKSKVINYRDVNGSYGTPARLFPIENLEEDEIVIVEGEKDCIVLNDRGIVAITATAGANYWNPAWNAFFEDKTIYICFDQDAAGTRGAANVAKNISEVTDVLIIQLPDASDEIKGFDVTDFLTEYGGSVDDFRELMLDAAMYSTPYEPEDEDEPEPEHVPLGLASLAKYNGRPITTNVVVSGKSMAPYLVPREVRVRCRCTKPDDSCPTCPRWHKSSTPTKDYDEVHHIYASQPEILKLINCSTTQQVGYIKDIVGIAKNCNHGSFEIEKFGNMQQIILIPELDQIVYDDEAEYVSRNAYYLGHDIISNRSYELTGYTHPDPNSQIATHVFSHKNDAQDNIRAFVLTPEIHEQLAETFRPTTGQTIDEKLTDIYNYFTREVHFVRGRPEMQLAFDLVWHSILTFDFLGQPVRKGWLEGLILGDTSQGKTELTSRMRDYYNLGARITGEKTSSAGLVGGLQKAGDRWILQWGAYPQQDRRAILIDEYSSLSEEDISNMTDLRSTGVAEIVKVRTERTHARVRGVLCSNARSGRMLRTYMHAISAVRELMGKAEDIRRLDFAVIAASGEVPLDLINAPVSSLPTPLMEYSREACKNLVLFAWSRNMLPATGQVAFEDSAQGYILESARLLGHKYHSKIPLIEPSDQRLKLARMSAALAARLYSTDETGEVVVVNEDHVDYIKTWLEQQYDKPSMGYNMWSEVEKRADIFTTAVEEQITKHLVGSPNGFDIIVFLSQQTRPWRMNDFQDSTNIDKDTARSITQLLMRNHGLVNTSVGFRGNPNLNDLLRRLRNGEKIGGLGLEDADNE